MTENVQKPEVEALFFKRMMQFCFVVSIINILGNMVVGLSFVTNIKWLILMPLSLAGLNFTEDEALRPWFLSTLYAFIIFLFIPSGWKTSGGYNYLTLGYVLLVAMSIGFLLKGKLRVIFAFLELFVFLFLAYFQYNDPMFVDTLSNEVLLTDLYIQTPIIFLTVIYMSTVFAEAYRNERKGMKIYSDLLAEKNKTLERITKTDELTGLYNRRYIFEKLEKTVHKGQEAIIIMMDIDDFKRINDGYGHLVGDAVIRLVSESIKDVVSDLGQVGRYGGDEFVIILEACSEREALDLTQSIQERVKGLDLGIDKQVTVSGGMAKLDRDADIDETLTSADEIMYWVKQNGKGQIVNKDSRRQDEEVGQKSVS